MEAEKWMDCGCCGEQMWRKDAIKCNKCGLSMCSQCRRRTGKAATWCKACVKIECARRIREASMGR